MYDFLVAQLILQNCSTFIDKLVLPFFEAPYIARVAMPMLRPNPRVQYFLRDDFLFFLLPAFFACEFPFFLSSVARFFKTVA